MRNLKTEISKGYHLDNPLTQNIEMHYSGPKEEREDNHKVLKQIAYSRNLDVG